MENNRTSLSRYIVSGVIVVVLLVVLFLLLESMRSHRQIVDASAARDAGKPIPVATTNAEVGQLRPLLVGACVSNYSKVADIASPIRDPIVAEVMAGPGAKVKQGDVLVKLDDRTENAQVEKYRNRVDRLIEQLKEHESLVEYFFQNRQQGQSLEIDYKRAKVELIETKTELSQARGDLKLAQIELTKTEIKSPVTGIVSEMISAGQVSRQDTDLGTLAVIDPMYLACEFDSDDFNYVNSFAAQGDVSIRGLANEAFIGSFVKFEPEKEGEEGVKWIFEVDNPAHRIQAGMTGYIRFQSDEQVLRIPTVSILNRQENQGQVFVVSEDRAVNLVRVVIGKQSAGYTQILSGLKEGDEVVVSGQKDLIDGDAIAVVDPIEVTYPYGD